MIFIIIDFGDFVKIMLGSYFYIFLYISVFSLSGMCELKISTSDL